MSPVLVRFAGAASACPVLFANCLLNTAYCLPGAVTACPALLPACPVLLLLTQCKSLLAWCCSLLAFSCHGLSSTAPYLQRCHGLPNSAHCLQLTDPPLQFSTLVRGASVRDPVLGVLSYFASWEHMGNARVDCISKHKCEQSDFDGYQPSQHISVPMEFLLNTTAAVNCTINVTVLSETGSGEHKIRLLSVFAKSLFQSGKADSYFYSIYLGVT